MFAMNKEAAQNQVSLVVEAYDSLTGSREALRNTAGGQTTTVWTADGKSVPLASVLTVKYGSAVQWLDDSEKQLVDAAEKLKSAIKDTENLDDRSREDYLAQLNRILGQEA